jgi:hypothetical protein
MNDGAPAIFKKNDCAWHCHQSFLGVMGEQLLLFSFLVEKNGSTTDSCHLLEKKSQIFGFVE